jgi:hypothetical protein
MCRSHRQCPPERIAAQTPHFTRDAHASDETNAGTASRRQVVDQERLHPIFRKAALRNFLRKATGNCTRTNKFFCRSAGRTDNASKFAVAASRLQQPEPAQRRAPFQPGTSPGWREWNFFFPGSLFSLNHRADARRA